MVDLDQALSPKVWKSENLKLAFTHRSYLNESAEANVSNERLEFLGDSVLSLVISEMLYGNRETDTEGALTNLRAYIVKTTSLAKAAKALDLGSRLSLSKGEEQSGGRENTQLLANTYEAVLGAIFLEEGLESAKKFVSETLVTLFEEEIKNGPPKDAKSHLQELSQSIYKTSPIYSVVKTVGPDHARIFSMEVEIAKKVYGHGQGASKQIAEEAAAAEAIINIEKNR
jgi:ribonuclease-3